MAQSVEISRKTIVFITLLVLLGWLLFQIWDILLMFFISLILMAALNPLVDRLEKLRLPRSLAIILVYIVLWGTVGTLVASLVPTLVEETSRLIRLLPSAVNRLEFFSTHEQEISRQLLIRIGSLPESLLKVTVGLFGNLLGVLTTLVITFYLLLDHKHLSKYLSFLAGPLHHEKSARVIKELEARLGSWVRGELVLMIAVGLLTYPGLLLLGIDNALPLAIIAGFLEIIPNIGPTISAIPAVLVALTINPLTAVATASLYLLVQFLENHLLVPKIMQKAVGVNPLVSILGLMIGFRLSGPLGAVLAIPMILVVQSIGSELIPLNHLRDSPQIV